jgi:hypothetical protein
VAATGVKFWLGSTSTLGEKVASSLVWRFGTLDYISDNLTYFGDSFGDSGSFLDVSGHHFYIAKPFPEEVTDMFDPLCDTSSSCSESSDLGIMVEVLALEEDGGSNLPCSMRPPLEHPPLPKQDLPPLERDILESTIMDLRAPLDLTADLAKLAEDLEQTRPSSSTGPSASKTPAGASTPWSASTIPRKATHRLGMAQAGQDKFISEAEIWARS